jgi:polysaccharide export outer membrane protein
MESLKSAGYENIKHVDNGLECLLQVYEEIVPDAIIMDHQLGMVNGVEVLQKIRAYQPDLKVIFMSGQKDVKIAIQSVKLGAMDYIIKDATAIPKLLELLKAIEAETEEKNSKSQSKKILPKIKKFLTDND